MTETKKPNTQPQRSIANLRIYQLALSLEEQAYALAKTLPADQFDLGNDLRRASAGVAHYIFDAHRRFSYSLKMESLHAAREQAETASRLLEQIQDQGFGQTKELVEDYTTLIKQSWGLIKWLKQKQTEKDAIAQVKAKDQLVEARN